MRKESHWMEWALIVALRSSLEKEAWSLPLDDALEKEEAFLTLGCFGFMRCRKKCWLPLSQPFTSSPNNVSLEVSHGSISFILPRLHVLTPVTTHLFCWATLSNQSTTRLYFSELRLCLVIWSPHITSIQFEFFHTSSTSSCHGNPSLLGFPSTPSRVHQTIECQSFVRNSAQRFLLTRETFLAWFPSRIVASQLGLPPSSLVAIDVKMGFNPWANPAHHGFEPDWVEKNSTRLT